MSEFFRLYFIHDAMYDVVCTHALSVCIRLDSTPAGTQLKILLPPLRQSALECRHNNSLSLSLLILISERGEREVALSVAAVVSAKRYSIEVGLRTISVVRSALYIHTPKNSWGDCFFLLFLSTKVFQQVLQSVRFYLLLDYGEIEKKRGRYNARISVFRKYVAK